MSEQKKFLDANGVRILWDKISMQDYPNNATLMAVINAIDATKADKEDVPKVDATLSTGGAAADAKAVSEAIENIELTPGPKGDKGDKGDPGNKGDKGDPGYSPIRGTDYWTESDKAEIKAYVDETILGGAW